MYDWCGELSGSFRVALISPCTEKIGIVPAKYTISIVYKFSQQGSVFHGIEEKADLSSLHILYVTAASMQIGNKFLL